ncbi:hypothetical protein WI25_22220 [Burkholderia cepacia]|nr:hypothetical protein WI25_22220 [Burkholderia cepacia]
MRERAATCCFLYLCLDLAKQLTSIVEYGFSSQSFRVLCFRLEMHCVDAKRVRHISIRRRIVADVNVLARCYSIEVFDIMEKSARALVDADVAGTQACRHKRVDPVMMQQRRKATRGHVKVRQEQCRFRGILFGYFSDRGIRVGVSKLEVQFEIGEA